MNEAPEQAAQRCAFEAMRALFGRGYTASNGWFDRWPDGKYKRVETQSAWEGWLMKSAAIVHFRTPKLEISDEEIRALWDAQDFVTQHPPGVERAMANAFARAVIAKVGGKK